MKFLIPFILFGIFSGLVLLQTGDTLKHDTTSVPVTKNQFVNNGETRKHTGLNSYYDIDVSFLPASKKIKVHEKLLWINKTSFATKEFYLHFYINAYKSNNTIFARGNYIPSESITSLQLNSLSIKNREVIPEFVNTDETNKYDSTVAKIKLPKELHPGDSLYLTADYEFQIPKAVTRMGYAPGEDFYAIAQWFIKPGVFQDGKWICSPFFPNVEFFADFGDYNISIESPAEFQIVTSGNELSPQNTGNNLIKHRFFQSNVHDFVWIASRYFKKITDYYQSNEGKTTEITLLVPKVHESFIPRYKEILHTCFSYFEEHFENYTYHNFTLVINPPRFGNNYSMEYPGLVTVSHSIFSPPETQEPERTIIHEFAHQYFYGILANNEVYEAWLDEGFADYMTDRILEYKGIVSYSYFRLFGYIPVKGLELLSLGEIPLIYSMQNIPIPGYTDAMIPYYENLNSGSLSDSSYLLNDEESYWAISYNKGELFLKTLERVAGKNVMDKILRKYYDRFKFSHPTAKDFIKITASITQDKLDWFFSDYYYQSFISDYSISKLYQNPATRRWVVEIKRVGEARFPFTVALYTKKDTLRQKVFLTQRFTSVSFSTDNIIIGAEIDPERKNYFDVNFANNSYFLDEQAGSSLYLSVRWFYWIQSFLLIFGGIA